MPDPTAAPAPATTPGAQTSEYKLTQFLVVVGIVLQALAGALQTLPADVQGRQWFAIASLVMGTALQVLAALGYVQSRTQVKVTQAAPLPPQAPPQP